MLHQIGGFVDSLFFVEGSLRLHASFQMMLSRWSFYESAMLKA